MRASLILFAVFTMSPGSAQAGRITPLNDVPLFVGVSQSSETYDVAIETDTVISSFTFTLRGGHSTLGFFTATFDNKSAQKRLYFINAFLDGVDLDPSSEIQWIISGTSINTKEAHLFIPGGFSAGEHTLTVTIRSADDTGDQEIIFTRLSLAELEEH